MLQFPASFILGKKQNNYRVAVPALPVDNQAAFTVVYLGQI
jgi:hypothetical protein